jgi:hypothetical protein
MAYVADTRAEAQDMLRTQLPRWLGPGLAWPARRRPAAHTTRPRRVRRVPLPHSPGRNAEDCLRTMATTVERTGVRHLILMVEGGGDATRTQDNMTRLGTQVLPRLRTLFTSR